MAITVNEHGAAIDHGIQEDRARGERPAGDVDALAVRRRSANVDSMRGDAVEPRRWRSGVPAALARRQHRCSPIAAVLANRADCPVDLDQRTIFRRVDGVLDREPLREHWQS